MLLLEAMQFLDMIKRDYRTCQLLLCHNFLWYVDVLPAGEHRADVF